MTADYKVAELFCVIDEFCKHSEAGYLLEDKSGAKRRRRAASLSDSEIMTILLYFHFGTFRNFKLISGDMPIRYSRELPLTEKEQWVGAMALSSTLRAMTEAR